MGCGASKKVSAPQGNVTFKIFRLELQLAYITLTGKSLHRKSKASVNWAERYALVGVKRSN